MTLRTGLLIAVALLLLPCGCAARQGDPGAGKDKAYLGRPLGDVLEELKSPDPVVRLHAVKLLSYGPTKEAVPGLRQAAEDPDPGVAEQAAKGLRWVGPDAEAAVPTLIKRLKDPPSEGFREAALAALGGIGPKAAAAVPLLVAQLRQQQTPLKARQTAVAALGQMGPAARAAVPALTDALDERALEQDAIAALIQMGEEARPAVPALGKRLRPEGPHWLALVRFLAEIEPQAARAAIPDLRVLASSEPVRDRGIVNFRQSERRIDEAKELLNRLGPRENK
jgi:hypothetical protein